MASQHSPLGIHIHLILHNAQKADDFPTVTYFIVYHCVWLSFHYTRPRSLKVDVTHLRSTPKNINSDGLSLKTATACWQRERVCITFLLEAQLTFLMGWTSQYQDCMSINIRKA